ncbi:MAG: twin-arginine translocase subunit TatC [Desulfobacterota bacterium]|nr:twin-arginine translocase subunit TatC [Thermodesulfobacteriota bacterium]
MDEDKLPVTDHLEELRRRLIKCLLAVLAGFALSYSFSKQLFDLLTWPLMQAMPADGKLIYTSLQEAFITYLKISFFAGIFLAAPVIFYQLWKFVMPGLYANERRYVLPFVIAACAFFLLGASFAFFVAFPFGFRFFLGFTTERIQALPSMKEYLSLCMSLLLAFGITFELPVVMFFLARMGLVDHLMLKRYRKYAILVIAIVAAVLTPPDILSMTLLGIPLYLLFEVSVVVTYLFGKKKAPAMSGEKA